MSKLAHSCEATMAIIASQNCGECNGKTYVFLLGEEYPCPHCQEDAFEEQRRERALAGGQFGAGA